MVSPFFQQGMGKKQLFIQKLNGDPHIRKMEHEQIGSFDLIVSTISMIDSGAKSRTCVR